ncbi:MAG: hypothetical protein WCG84_03010 [Candidatus Moraniibacteriota bacterium]
MSLSRKFFFLFVLVVGLGVALYVAVTRFSVPTNTNSQSTEDATSSLQEQSVLLPTDNSQGVPSSPQIGSGQTSEKNKE